MRDRSLPPTYLPRAPLWRRGGATAIDAVLVGLLSSLLGSSLYLPVFCLFWFLTRVVIPANNRGQSFGRLAFDIKLIDERSRRIPTFLDLAQREGIIGLEAFFALNGLSLLGNVDPIALLSIAPVLADGAVAALDEDRRLAFHDRLLGTTVLQTHRGFSLDLKLKRWWLQLKNQGERWLPTGDRPPSREYDDREDRSYGDRSYGDRDYNRQAYDEPDDDFGDDDFADHDRDLPPLPRRRPGSTPRPGSDRSARPAPDRSADREPRSRPRPDTRRSETNRPETNQPNPPQGRPSSERSPKRRPRT